MKRIILDKETDYNIVCPSTYFSVRCVSIILLLAVMSVSTFGGILFEYISGAEDSIVPPQYNHIVIPICAGVTVLLVISFFISIYCKKTIIVDSKNKKLFEGMKIFGNYFGEWKTFNPNDIPNLSYLSFQQFGQTQTFNFMGVTKNEVEENVFELRFISQNKFKTFISTSDMNQLPAMVRMGRALSSTYGIKFCDYVKDAYRRENMIK